VSKGKLKRFAELNTFSNVLQPSFKEVFNNDFYLKGKWNREFFHNEFPVILELGCGKGEYTLGLAKQNPTCNFLGIDVKGARIWKGAKAALNEQIINAGFLRTRIDFINSFFASGEVQEIWITFPDPQPKKSRKRLTSSFFLNRYRAFLTSDNWINLKTDNADLFHYTYRLAEYNKLTIDFITNDLYASGYKSEILSIRTFYENMWLKAGLPIHFIRFRLRPEITILEPPDEE